MKAKDLTRAVEVDLSGVGHCWRPLDPESAGDHITELDGWLVEDKPQTGDEMQASNGLRYRVAD